MHRNRKDQEALGELTAARALSVFQAAPTAAKETSAPLFHKHAPASCHQDGFPMTTKDITRVRYQSTVEARKAAEAVMEQAAITTSEPELAQLIAQRKALFDAFGVACNLTDEMWRKERGLPENPSRADHRAWSKLNTAHERACRALLNYQPRDMAELATLAGLFGRIDVCDPDKGVKALARMVRNMAKAPPPTGGGDVARMLAEREAFNDALEATDAPQATVDAALDQMDAMDGAIVSAPCVTASDAAAKLRLLLAYQRDLRDVPALCQAILPQVAAWLDASNLPRLSPDDAELIAMAPEWDRATAEWDARNSRANERMRAARRELAGPGYAHLSSDERWALLGDLERRHGVYEPDASIDEAGGKIERLLKRARQLNAATMQGLAVKVAMCAWYHRADGENAELHELLRNLGQMVGQPLSMVAVEGADFYTPYQWVLTWLAHGGSFTRDAEGRMLMGSPASPDVPYLEEMKRSVGMLPNPDGSAPPPAPTGYLDEVRACAALMMDEQGSDVLVDKDAQERRSRLIGERRAALASNEAAA